MILAGDIGGTKTHLALFDWTTERVEPLRLETFHSADYASLEDMLEEFLAPPKPPTPIDTLEPRPQDEPSSLPQDELPPIRAACFGVAGPVIQNHSRTTNLPWVVDGAALAKRSNYPPYSCSTISRRWRTALCSSMPMRW
jgi:glucokinase